VDPRVFITHSCFRALLPDLINFAYIPQNELRIHGDSQGQRDRSPDFSTISAPSDSLIGGINEAEEHVLVLDFADNSRGKKSQNSG
jgi:DEAD/DEAH box helicase domain-containing protein